MSASAGRPVFSSCDRQFKGSAGSEVQLTCPSHQLEARSGKRRGSFVPWRWLRRLAQIACLLGFLLLFRLTEYRGQDVPAEPLNLLFRINPLTALSAFLGTLTWTALFWPALVLLALTVLLGRFFCGWICPLGTTLDACHRAAAPARWMMARRRHNEPRDGMHSPPTEKGGAHVGAGTGASASQGLLHRLRPVRYVLLILILLFAVLHLPIVGYFDPLAILYRALAFAFDPWLGNAGSTVLADTRWSESARGTVLPFYDKTITLAWVAVGMLGAILLAELIARRFWCRYLCPLGAMLGVVGKLSPLVRVPVGACGNCPACTNCAGSCRMDAFDGSGKLQSDACTLCMDCAADCPRGIARFTWRKPRPAAVPVDLSRRAALTTLAAGVAVPLIARSAGAASHTPGPHLLRPPGASSDENHFTDACIRCGLCIKVCPTGALQPAKLQAGFDGIFSPLLTPRMGYCEVGCTLCGQVCPTGAIPILTTEQKEQTILGKAVIDRNRCLPWATGEECICCEEHCPVYNKAIVFRDDPVVRPDGSIVSVQVPFVRFGQCIGCGICENKCPLEGESAIRVVREEFAEHQGPGQGRRRGRR
jgi:MauM/NapG family ferredoxin protein